MIEMDLFNSGAESSTNIHEKQATLNLQLAFVLNSLFYNLLRVQGKQLRPSEGHKPDPLNVVDQLQKIKGYFVKTQKHFKNSEE